MHYVVCIRPSLERDNQSASPQSTPFITAVLLLEFNSFYVYAFAVYRLGSVLVRLGRLTYLFAI